MSIHFQKSLVVTRVEGKHATPEEDIESRTELKAIDENGIVLYDRASEQLFTFST